MRRGYYIKDLVYGANDGIITTFAVVASVAGADLSVPIVLVIGFASLLADAFSMASSNYLGTKSEHEALCAGAAGGCVGNGGMHRPLASAGLTFFAFVSAGLIPLAPFIWLRSVGNIFPYATLCTAIALFMVGASRSAVTGKRVLSSGLEMLVVGGVAAAIAYYVGAIARAIVG